MRKKENEKMINRQREKEKRNRFDIKEEQKGVKGREGTAVRRSKRKRK